MTIDAPANPQGVETSLDNNVLIRSGEARLVGCSWIMLYSGFNNLHRSVIRRQTGFAARITRTLSRLLNPLGAESLFQKRLKRPVLFKK